MNNSKTTFVTFKNMALQYEVPSSNNINTTDCDSYLEEVQKSDILPFSKGNIRFSSDLWDFSQYSSLNINKCSFRFYFEPFPECYKVIVKKFILISLINNMIKIQTLFSKHGMLKVFLLEMERKGIMSVLDIEKNNLQEFFNNLENKNRSLSTIQNYKDCLKDFFSFYDANIGQLINRDVLSYLNVKNKKVFQAYKEAHKSAVIPDWYYNKLLSGLIHYMNDENCPYYIKGPACMYILLSQQGNRIGELLSLTTLSLKTKTAFNGDELSYLYYKSWKGSKGNNTSTQNFTYINELSRKAFDTLVNIPEFRERREKWNIDYLYCGGKFTYKEQFPLASKNFSEYSEEMWKMLDIDGFLETANLNKEDYPFLEFRKAHSIWQTRLSSKGEVITVLAHPTTQQFRFHVCTELYNKGVPLPYIKRFMAHLTEQMTAFHIHKNRNKIQEDLTSAKRILSGIVTGEEKIIGGDKGLTENINKFIEANHFNVEKDLDTIVSKLAEDIPIRIKTGGVCIKSSRFRPCSIDSRTDEMYCAYNVCPNIFHFYYHCGITWRKCKELKEVIDINQKRGLLKQVYKDTNNLRSIISHQLLPEMDELQVQLKDKGINTIYEKYPDLIDIIENFDEIKKEVTSWLQQTQQK